MENEKNRELPNPTVPSMVVPDGFCEDDLHQPAYCAPLESAAREIVNQNLTLIDRLRQPDFRPEVELEYSNNGANVYINDVFEQLARYEEGRIPRWPLVDMVKTTDRLTEALRALSGAPHAQLCALSMAFHEANAFWAKTYPMPQKPRKVYLKQLFAARDKITTKLGELHLAYQAASIESRAAAKRRSGGRPERDSAMRKKAEDRRRVIQAIGDLRKRRGVTLSRAIRILRNNPTWATRMGKVSDASWRVYCSKQRVVKTAVRETCLAAQEAAQETNREKRETNRETNREKRETNRETNREKRETNRETNRESGETNRETNRESGETNRETNRENRLKKLIQENPALTIAQLSSISGLSYEGVRYHLRMLSKTCGLSREGSTKKGHWVFTGVKKGGCK